MLILLRGYVFRNIFKPTIQDSAKVIQRSGVHGLVFSQLINGGTGNTMMVDKRVGGFVGTLQRCPEPIIFNHAIIPSIATMISFYAMVLLLTIVVKKTIM